MIKWEGKGKFKGWRAYLMGPKDKWHVSKNPIRTVEKKDNKEKEDGQ